MNRRTKIIVSVAGIFIVLLALLGLTYGYFLTKINGNTNDKSIDLATANLELTYSDDSNEIIGKNQTVEPGFTATKTFSITNNGNDTSYVVVFENVENDFVRKQDIVYTLTCSSGCNGVNHEETFPSTETAIIVGNSITKEATQTYKLTVTYKNEDVDQSIDMNKTLRAKINIKDPNSLNPYKSNKNSLAYNIINNATTKRNGTEFLLTPITIPAQEVSGLYKGNGKTYELELTLANIGNTNPNITQESDIITWSVYSTTVSDPGRLSNCYWGGSNNPSLCGDEIHKNATQCSDLIGSYISGGEEAYIGTYYVTRCDGETPIATVTSEQELSVAPDDYGTSYYYRGSVKDNYLELNDMCFRIVRIEGDGSIKITLAKEGKCSTITDSDVNSALIENGKGVVYGYNNDGNNNYTFNYEGYSGSNGLYKALESWYNSKLKTLESKLKNETWCLGGKTSKYDNTTGELTTNPEGDGYFYETGARLFGPSNKRSATYKCSDEADIVTSYFGSLTADEVAFAGAIGGAINSYNSTYYLSDNAQLDYWLLSRHGFYYDYGYGDRESACYISGGPLSGYEVDYPFIGARPAVTLASGTKLASGDGTKGNPYKIVES